jgi:hypothetical protein
METPTLDIPNAENATRAFRAAIDMLPEPSFAILDGGHFDDLQDELADAGINSRSLFLPGGDADMLRDGPWLVSLTDRSIRAHIEGLAVEKPCAVFWSCPDGEQALWQHLRSINEIMIPDDRIAGNDGKSGTPVKYERVLFRHWDPNVLGSLLPLLHAEQFARVFGPATGILMNATDYGGLKRAPRPNDLPSPKPGLLQIEPEQIDSLKEAMLHSSRLRIARYLKGNVPPHFSGTTDSYFWGVTLASEETADELGIRTERGRARWSYVMMLSDGKAAGAPEVRNYIQDGNGTPDNRV